MGGGLGGGVGECVGTKVSYGNTGSKKHVLHNSLNTTIADMGWLTYMMFIICTMFIWLVLVELLSGTVGNYRQANEKN